MVASGLLFVYGECGLDVDQAEFNDWYDNEHGPARLTVPGFVNASRYKASDTRVPSWLALYDLSTPAIATSAAYKDLGSQASDRERALIPRLAILNRRVYELASSTSRGTDSNEDAATHLVLFGAAVDAENEAHYAKWLEEQFLPSQSGYIRARRFKLVSAIELTGKPNDYPVETQITIVDYSNDPSPTSLPSYIPIGTTTRQFILHKQFK